MFRALLRPGQGFKTFLILRRAGKVTQTGRPVTGALEPNGAFYGMLTQASPREVEQWKQNGHPITHTIVQHRAPPRAAETDVLELEDGGKRRFLVQGVQDPGELGHFLVYRVEERKDLQ